MSNEFTHKLLALSMLPGIGRVTLSQLAKVSAIETMSIEELAKKSKRLASTLEKHGSTCWKHAQQKRDEQIKLAVQHNCKILSIQDPDYPELLAQTADAPPLLFVKGALSKKSLSVAVIGTRKPSPAGILLARKATKSYVEKGASIISGLALGCDTIAHETALDCGGHTVAILAHGLQTVEPESNRQLAQRILDSGGALVTEYPLGTRSSRHYFVARDRIQAGISNGVVLIQSTLTGGSLHASKAILEYGRWLEVAKRNDDSETFAANDILLGEDDRKRIELIGSFSKGIITELSLDNK